MLFKSLRRGSKSSTLSSGKSPQPQPADPQSHQMDATAPKILNLSSTLSSTDEQKVDDDSRDFQLFLEKTKLDEEKRERARVNAIKEAERRKKACNMSPWAGRM